VIIFVDVGVVEIEIVAAASIVDAVVVAAIAAAVNPLAYRI
jgi:hypothetical protein